MFNIVQAHVFVSFYWLNLNIYQFLLVKPRIFTSFHWFSLLEMPCFWWEPDETMSSHAEGSKSMLAMRAAVRLWEMVMWTHFRWRMVIWR